ncbi:TetR/AcrR family transcriptional regulator [Streptomyces sp. NBC_01016]|uniref:TetR/AcrR family transcriptional regulator n=1 Tax=Streptomyces sp. NBC_01016 TaxID=2903720 RepID=UPI00225987F8|nr:TetR/AcrR family transcriptional regulator [Streptomyces sp. NBC_01016]MCX4834464.1 TetR/AcrR family transcriptional regulator [Streptomyces sp. NBC_01016]
MASRGRPRGFDRDRALEQALRVFWEHGYQGASMAALTSAMGIKSPSLYAAYGSKEELFREALALYAATEGSYTRRALDEQPTARESVEAALRDNAAAYTDPATPRGCLVILAAPLATPDSADVADTLARLRTQTREAIQGRIERGIADGDLPVGTDAARLAAFYATVLNGLSFQARDGASLAALNTVIDQAMRCWPEVSPVPER